MFNPSLPPQLVIPSLIEGHNGRLRQALIDALLSFQASAADRQWQRLQGG